MNLPVHETAPSIALWPGLRHGLAGIRLVICDLWGVVHDGLQLSANAIEALEALNQHGIPHVLLTNAPRPRSFVQQQLAVMGLASALMEKIITSGSVSRSLVRTDFAGLRCYHLGPETDENLLEGLPVTMVESPGQADVILASGLDFETPAEHVDYLRAAAERQVPFICANPDRVVHVGDRLWLCPGLIADIYEGLGGPVIHTGKPAAPVFQECLTLSGMVDLQAENILVIGDGLQTDILGANGFGARSLLISGGIHRVELAGVEDEGAGFISRQQFTGLTGQESAVPDAVMPRLEW